MEKCPFATINGQICLDYPEDLQMMNFAEKVEPSCENQAFFLIFTLKISKKSGVPQVLVNRNKTQWAEYVLLWRRNNICNSSYCCQYIFRIQFWEPNLFKQLFKAVEWDTGSITVELCHGFKAMMWWFKICTLLTEGMKLLITLSTLAGIWKTRVFKLVSHKPNCLLIIQHHLLLSGEIPHVKIESVCADSNMKLQAVWVQGIVLVFSRGCHGAMSEVYFLKINLWVMVNCELSMHALEWQNDNNGKKHGWNDLGRKLEFCSKIMKFLGKNQNRLTFKHVPFKTFMKILKIVFYFYARYLSLGKKNVGGAS